MLISFLNRTHMAIMVTMIAAISAGMLVGCSSVSSILSESNPLSQINFQNGAKRYYNVYLPDNTLSKRVVFEYQTGVSTGNATNAIVTTIHTYNSPTAPSTETPSSSDSSASIQNTSGLFPILNGTVTQNATVQYPLTVGKQWTYNGYSYEVISYETVTTDSGLAIPCVKLEYSQGGTRLIQFVDSNIGTVKLIRISDNVTESIQILTSPF